MAKAQMITLTCEERKVLSSGIRSGNTESRLVERAKIILVAAKGGTTQGMPGR